MTTNVVPLPVHFIKKRISVIMVSFFTGASLMEAVAAVLADQDIFELVIVDNGNTVSARERLWALANQQRRVRIVQGHGNVGFGRGCNYGAKIAKGDYFLFLNPDAVIENGAAMAMADCGERLTKPWITGGFLQTEHGTEQRGSRRDVFTPISALVSFTSLHKFPNFQSVHLENQKLPIGPTAMPVVSGACMMTDRKSFEILGGFDEHYFLHVEDIDICRRAAQMGGEVYFVPNAKVMHYGSTSKARLLGVEGNKLTGFLRYFWRYSSKIWAKCLLILAAPFMALVIMGRALWLSVRNPWV